jgi:type IV secretory pathway VirB9-like protein
LYGWPLVKKGNTMKTLIFFSLPGVLLAATPPAVPIKILPARTVTVGERSVIDIDVAPLQNTLIVLPLNERVRNIFNGDAADWAVEQPPGAASRYLSIKVKTDDPVTTTISVISDHEKSYTFRLVRNAVQGDSKVFVDPDSQLAADIAKPADWVPRAEADARVAASEQAAKDAETKAAAAKLAADSQDEQFRAEYPSKLRFDYKFDRKKAELFGVQAMFTDGRFFYIRADPTEAPALYESKDGKPSLIQWTFRDGVYTAGKIVTDGWLTIGKERLLFHREGA